MKTQLPVMVLFLLFPTMAAHASRRHRPPLSATTKKPAFSGWLLSFSALYLSPLRYSPPLGPGFTRHPSPTHPDPFRQVSYSNSK